MIPSPKGGSASRSRAPARPGLPPLPAARTGPPGGRLVVIGCSAGGTEALIRILTTLPRDFPLAIMVVIHRPASPHTRLAAMLSQASGHMVEEAVGGSPLCSGRIVLAPPDYHLLVESDGTVSLSVDPMVSYARPAIDILFESAAEAYGADVTGILLTGANQDGSAGLKRIQARGGHCIAQSPVGAYATTMPEAAIALEATHAVLELDQIGEYLRAFAHQR